MTSSHDGYFEPYYDALLELSKAQTDWNRYIQLLQRAEAAGDDHAAYALSSLYLHGFDQLAWRKNRRLGLRLLRKATRSVHLAMVELASIYEGGEQGCRKNSRKAFALFMKSVSFGSVVGRYHAGRCLYHGIGTRSNRAKALRLLRSAAKLGFPVP
jgi:TPR repeat protein